jgi:hypothetical protein
VPLRKRAEEMGKSWKTKKLENLEGIWTAAPPPFLIWFGSKNGELDPLIG